jgi:hypothetical protein
MPLSSEAGLLLCECVAEGLLEFECDGIVWIDNQNRVQLFNAGAQFLQEGGGVVGGGVKLSYGGWRIGLSGLDVAGRIAQEGLRYILCLEWHC